MLRLLSTSLLLMSLTLTSTPTMAQNTAGGFGNFGIGSGGSAFGSVGSTTAGGTGAAGGTSGAASGTSGILSLGGGGFGGFDSTFGAAQFASSLAGATALSQTMPAFGRTGGFGGGFGGFGGFGGGGFGGGGLGGRGGFNNQNNMQNETSIRAVVRIGFDYTGPPAATTARNVSDRFAKMPLPGKLGQIQIEMEGRTVILRGEVASAENSKLAERLLSLEPGIDAVRNELIVVGEGSTGTIELVPAPLPAE